jgi:hypothetical protein
MRNQLVGYLLGSLEDDEARDVESALADSERGGALRRDLQLLEQATAPLKWDRAALPAPAGLASRTLAFVAAHTRPETIPLRRPMSPVHEGTLPAGRGWLDRVLLAASALAACVLVAPLIYETILDSRARRAERKLQRLSESLQGYAETHRVYPTPPESGPMSRAGLYAPMLVSEHRLVADDGTLLVPDSKLTEQGSFRVPTLDEVRAAMGTPEFEPLVRRMGGDFGYTLGHRDAEGRLLPNRNHRRVHHPLLADAPDDSGEQSRNHPDGAHYILFEDGHVERRRLGDHHHEDDHLYRNHDGEIAAGLDPEDDVIGGSHQQP